MAADQSKVVRMRKVLVVAGFFAVLFSGCDLFVGPPGPAGPAGPAGPTGPAGPAAQAQISLLRTLTYTFTPTSSTRNYRFTVPEIRNRHGETFALGYSAFSTSPTLWSPVADGWLDSATSATYLAVSWDYGTVTFMGFPTGYTFLLRLDVYGPAAE